MKKISIIALFACALFSTSCENDAVLDDTRVAEVTAPTVAFEVAVNKYDATFTFNTTAGNPAAREVGVMVSTSEQPTVENSQVFVADAEGTAVASLNPGTTYYAVAYALTANSMVRSEVKSFTTESHPLGAYLGAKTMSAYNLFAEAVTDFAVTITPDAEDETVAYLTGLGSEQVNLPLGEIKLIFDLENKCAVIPNGQIIDEPNYGAYRWVGLDQDASPVAGDLLVTLEEDGSMSISALAAMIVEGGNAGLFHWGCFDITIK